MNLVVDYGNSRIKAGLFSDDQLIQHDSFAESLAFVEWLKGKSFDHAIVSSVSHQVEEIWRQVNATGLRLILSHTIPLPVTIDYETPHTLGVDRIAAACGAVYVVPNRDRLVIDMGTCINYEFIDSKSIYHGGAISPGVSMRFEAMHTFTARLPFVKPRNNPPLTGDSTEACMQSGVVNGIVAEMNGIVNSYVEIYPQLGVILCGGDANLFENKLKHPIFVAPNLVLSGLNRILLHNVNT